MKHEIDHRLLRRRKAILKIAQRHGARNVRVFGSYVRGQAGPHSDIDLLVDVGPNLTPFFPGGLVADLEDLLGRRIDVVVERALHPLARDRVLREALPL